MDRQTGSASHVGNHMPLPPPTSDLKHDPPHYHTEYRKQALPPPDPVSRPLDEFDRSLKPPLYPPPSYQLHDTTMSFPHRENNELAPILAPSDSGDSGGGSHGLSRENSHGSNNNHTLPSLSSITATPPSSISPLSAQPPTQRLPEPVYSPPAPPPVPPPLTHWPSLNPLTAYYTPSHVENPESPMKMDLDTSSTSTVSTSSPDYASQDGRASSVSLDDPDVRLAAEALGDLRADFVTSPLHRQTPPRSPPSAAGQQPEPLLSLLTTTHPFLATTIDSATSAYTNSKKYYPRFKTSIEYVEGCVMPLANTVGSVGRVTGVENGVRWFLRRAQPHDGADSASQGSHKRRKVQSENESYGDKTPEPGSGTQTPRASYESPLDRRLSITSTVDTLPAYDDLRSPPYDENAPGTNGLPNGPPWQSRLIMSTSALSIAMSEESLRSLKYCLSWIRWANLHIGNVVKSLTIAMEKYEKRRYESRSDHSPSGRGPEDRSQLAATISALRSDVLKTLQDVINTVSRYAGGALPENAREVVRRHLTSLPQRFHLASLASTREEARGQQQQQQEQQQKQQQQQQQQRGEAEEEKATKESARRALLLAKEGLDMMSQVSGVLNFTIVSAEEWCARLHRRKREQREGLFAAGDRMSPLEEKGERMVD